MRGCIQAMKLFKFSQLATIGPTGDIMVQDLTAKKIFELRFSSGPPSIKMPQLTKHPRVYFLTSLCMEKASELPIELEHKSLLGLKANKLRSYNYGRAPKSSINELNELRDHAYETPLIYKPKSKSSMTPNQKPSGYQQKDRNNQAKNGQKEIGMEKTVQNQAKVQKWPKSEFILKDQQSIPEPELEELLLMQSNHLMGRESPIVYL
ncbi:hypothetical protein Tco_1211077 [Tanacetum coccineum]